MKVNVLSIDGGGIRGIIAAAILDAVYKCAQVPAYMLFDLICGTSTGGIIALGLGIPANQNQPYTPAELLRMYIENGQKIFKTNVFSGLKSIIRPKYSPAPLEAVLEEFFGGTMLSAALTPLLISSYDLHGQQPFFFKSHGIAAHPSWDTRARDAARATSAAPTFFPAFRYVTSDGDYALVDGGVFVNNPAMAAFAEAQRLYPQADEYVVVSVGTGDRNDRLTYRKAKQWGLLGWARQIVPVIMDSVSEAVDYELESIVRAGAKCRYHRFQPPLTIAAPNMDNASPQNLHRLQEQARLWISEHASDIARACRDLGKARGGNVPGTGRVTSAMLAPGR